MKKFPSFVLSFSLCASLALSCTPMATSANDAPREEASKSQHNVTAEARTFTREEYAAAATKMKKMVAAGEASQEDVDARLGRMRRAMKHSDGEKKSKVISDQKEMAGVKKRIGIAIKSGKITPEQGRERWAAYMESRNETAQTAAKERYDAALAKLLLMVEKGEITADQALRRLKGIRARTEKAENNSGPRH
ncbi:MAG: hypothetical protein QF524_00225 [Planctomycetota bacterium]|nr:hypothetical protein [Planctomycetota bacterium]